MIKWLREHKDNAILAAVISGLISVAVTGGGSVITYRYSVAGQIRQAKLDEALRFIQSSDKVISAGSDFISALNKAKGIPESKNIDVNEAKDKIKSESVNTILEADRAKILFDVDGTFREYLDSVDQFNKASQSTDSASDISVWISSFDRMVEARGKLTAEIYKSSGV